MYIAELGGIAMAPPPGVKLKAGRPMKPSFGTVPVLLNEEVMKFS